MASTTCQYREYTVAATGVTRWKDARVYCEARGGHLATVSSSDVANFLAYSVSVNGPQPRWIGLKRNVTGDFSVWHDDTPLTYTNWLPGEPNNLARFAPELCVVMSIADAALADKPKWNDANCNNAFNFVCQFCGSQRSCPRCLNNYGDCDAQVGCETNLFTSSAHCGACNQPCAETYACVSGVCMPPGSGTQTGTAGSGQDEGSTGGSNNLGALVGLTVGLALLILVVAIVHRRRTARQRAVQLEFEQAPTPKAGWVGKPSADDDARPGVAAWWDLEEQA